MVPFLLRLLPLHTIYVEVFGGGASLLFAKPPSPIEIYNDKSLILYDFFSVLADEELFRQFYRRVALLPHSRKFWRDYRDSWQAQEDRIERVARWFVCARQSFAGVPGISWGFSVKQHFRGLNGEVNNWLSVLNRLPEIHRRLQRVSIECNDWRRILQIYDTPHTLFFMDPPYPQDTRTEHTVGVYDVEMTTEDHIELIRTIVNLQGKVLLCSYPNDIYNELQQYGWHRRIKKTAAHSKGRTRLTKCLGAGSALRTAPRIEVIWYNYDLPNKNNLLTTEQLTFLKDRDG